VSETKPPVYFVRHGETEWNRLGLIQGWTDIPLNERGHCQAKAVGRALAGIAEPVSSYRFFVSPLERARQTMGHIAEALNLSSSNVAVDSSVKELGFGVWEGKPFWELKASPIYPADAETRYVWRPDGGESYADGHQRFKTWFDGITEPTVVVSHGAIGRCLIGYLTNLNPRDLVGLRMPQGCYCRLHNGQADWFDANGDAA
jgi:broad specificity phosphatase PhoE